jgi:hypothetical protein
MPNTNLFGSGRLISNTRYRQLTVLSSMINAASMMPSNPAKSELLRDAKFSFGYCSLVAPGLLKDVVVKAFRTMIVVPFAPKRPSLLTTYCRHALTTRKFGSVCFGEWGFSLLHQTSRKISLIGGCRVVS